MAEDNTVNQKVVLRMLAHLGYLADVAGNGQEVLAALERQDYDVVLMDIQMPDMDGIEATHRIHERFAGARRPWIVAMTANALRGDRERFLGAGMDGYLSKPIDIEDLAQALRQSHAATPAAPHQHVRSMRSTLDDAQLGNLLEVGGTRLLDEVIGHFEGEFAASVDVLRAHAADGDAGAVSSLSHRLSSTALNCGAVLVAETCRELEQCGRGRTMWLAPPLIERLSSEYETARDALRTFAATRR